jgi:5-methylcytosine-specific restriction endonuclease McrA
MKIDRQKVHNRCNGHCGYCGKSMTLKEMQVDHIIPKWKLKDPKYFKVTVEQVQCYDNYMPACRRCNHYKREKDLEEFRTFMKTLHERIEKDYKNKVALDYGIIEIWPFDGIFYFEKM